MSNQKVVGDKSEFDFADNVRWILGYVTTKCPFVCWVKVHETSTFNREELRHGAVAKLDFTTEMYVYTTEALRDDQIVRNHGRYIAGWPPHIPLSGAMPRSEIDYLEITRQIAGGQ